MNKQLMEIFLKIVILFIFLPGLLLPIPGRVFPVLLPLMIISYFIFVILFPKYVFRKLIFLYKYTPFKYLVYLLLWLIIDSIILIIIGKANFLEFYYIALTFIPHVFLCYLLAALFIPKFLSLKKVIRYFFSIILFILFWGLFQFLGDLFDISVIKNGVNTLSNWKAIAQNVIEMTDVVSGSVRVRSVFHEPGAMANFIFIILPIIYKLSLSKHSLFQNNYINHLIKIVLIPLCWICLLLTTSPIYLIFSIILTFIYFIKNILKFIKKYIICFVIFCFAIFVIFAIFSSSIMNILENTYIARIINTMQNITNFENLIKVEGSLASRICYFITQLQFFTHNPILGCGYENLRFHIQEQYLKTCFPLTPEIYQSISNSLSGITNGTITVKMLLSGLLAETGIIGTLLYFIFLFSNIKILSKIKNYFGGIEQDFLVGLQYSYIVIIFLAWYWYSMLIDYICFLYGISCVYIFLYTKKRRILLRQLQKEKECNH